MKTRILALLFCLPALFATTAPDVSASAGTPDFTEDFRPKKTAFAFGVPVPLPGERMFLVETKVNGVPAKMLVDTGASHTSLDLSWARKNFPAAKLRIVSTNPAEQNAYAMPAQKIPLMAIAEFSVGGNAFSDFFMPLVDLRGLRAALPELNDVAGILGMNTIALAPCRVSFKNRTLAWLDREGLAGTPGKKKLDVRAVPETDCVLVMISSPKDGRACPALIDCGAVGSSVPADFWIGARPEKVRAVTTTAAGTQNVEIAFGVPGELKFSEDFSLKNISPELLPPVGNAPQKILLGLDALSRFDLIFDREKGEVFAVPLEN